MSSHLAGGFHESRKRAILLPMLKIFGVLLVGVVFGACSEKGSEAPKEAEPAPQSANNMVRGSIDAAPAVASKDTAPATVSSAKTIVVPEGDFRFREARLSDAARLIAQLTGKNVVALETDSDRRDSFALPQEQTLDALAQRFEREHRIATKLYFFADDRSSKGLAKTPKGRNVDISFDGANGDDLIRLLSDVAGMKLRGSLGGKFTIQVREVGGIHLAAVLAVICGAEFSMNKGIMEFNGSKCAPNEPTAEGNQDSSEDSIEEEPPSWHQTIAIPKTLIEDEKSLRLIGLGVVSGRKAALLAGRSETAPGYVVEENTFVGLPGQHCAEWRKKAGQGASSPEVQSLQDDVLKALEATKSGKLDPKEARAKMTALEARLDEESRRIEQEARSHEKNRPVWCETGALGEGELLWRVARIGRAGVTLEPVLATAQPYDLQATLLKPYTGNDPSGPSAIDLLISD